MTPHHILFNSCALPIRRDLYIIEGKVMMVGGTHLSTSVMDYRTPDNEPYFGPLVANLGRRYRRRLRAYARLLAWRAYKEMST